MSCANPQYFASVMGNRSELELKKERIARQNPTSIPRRTPALRVWLVEKLLEAFRSRAPVGYEDETGFHFGVRPR